MVYSRVKMCAHDILKVTSLALLSLAGFVVASWVNVYSLHDPPLIMMIMMYNHELYSVEVARPITIGVVASVLLDQPSSIVWCLSGNKSDQQCW